jgi:hypothetical protein
VIGTGWKWPRLCQRPKETDLSYRAKSSDGRRERNRSFGRQMHASKHVPCVDAHEVRLPNHLQSCCTAQIEANVPGCRTCADRQHLEGPKQRVGDAKVTSASAPTMQLPCACLLCGCRKKASGLPWNRCVILAALQNIVQFLVSVLVDSTVLACLLSG